MNEGLIEKHWGDTEINPGPNHSGKIKEFGTDPNFKGTMFLYWTNFLFFERKKNKTYLLRITWLLEVATNTQ